MQTNILTKKLGLTVILGALTTAFGCESVSLVGRDTVEPRERREVDRRGEYDRRDRVDENSRRGEIYGTVQDVDERRREIRLRTDEGRTALIRYDSNTRVSDGRSDIRVGSLRSGDMVSIRLERSSGGEQYASAIRIEDRRGSWWR